MDTDYKNIIITSLELLCKKEAIARESFKVRAYNKVITQIKKLEKVTGIQDLKEITGVGKQIKLKLEEIFATGIMRSAEKVKTNDQITIYDSLTKVHGIGIVKAKELIKLGVKDTCDLNKQEYYDLLNDTQKVGLKYYIDINQKIPRKIMDLHNEYICKIIKHISRKKSIDLEYEIVGSYRRGVASSGDIDMLVRIRGSSTSTQRTELLSYIIAVMKKLEYIADDLANGSKKYMGVVKLKGDSLYRRLDILITSTEEWPYAKLYFTGSMQLNVQMRTIAKERGLNLNEYGFKKFNKNAKLPDHLSTEQDIFKFLGMSYLEPNQR